MVNLGAADPTAVGANQASRPTHGIQSTAGGINYASFLYKIAILKVFWSTENFEKYSVLKLIQVPFFLFYHH